jgi:tRNA(Ile)-lysidine synthase
MLTNGQLVGVAVSGGADSVALLLALVQLGYPCEVFHLNHLSRGPDSDADAAFVAELAGRLGLPLVAIRRPVPPEDSNFEQSARTIRYQELQKAKQERHWQAIATGHTISDQAETVLFRLLRGTGPSGLAGIFPKTAEGVIRPLLEVERADVLAFLEQQKQSFRTDQTNADLSFSRNRIRAEVLPKLAEFNPNVAHSLAQLASLVSSEELYWQQVTDMSDTGNGTGNGMSDTGNGTGNGTTGNGTGNSSANISDKLGGSRYRGGWVFECGKFLELSVAERRRWVRRIVEEVKGDLRGWEHQHVEAVLQLSERKSGDGRTQAPGIDVYRSFDWILLAPQGENSGLQGRFFEAEVRLEGAEIRMPDGITQVQISKVQTVGALSTADELDVAKLRAAKRIMLRTWSPGDEIWLTHSAERVKIKVLFQKGRIPIWKRKHWPVLTADEVVIWTRQFGAAVGFRAEPEAAERFRLVVSEG